MADPDDDVSGDAFSEDVMGVLAEVRRAFNEFAASWERHQAKRAFVADGGDVEFILAVERALGVSFEGSV